MSSRSFLARRGICFLARSIPNPTPVISTNHPFIKGQGDVDNYDNSTKKIQVYEKGTL